MDKNSSYHPHHRRFFPFHCCCFLLGFLLVLTLFTFCVVCLCSYLLFPSGYSHNSSCRTRPFTRAFCDLQLNLDLAQLHSDALQLLVPLREPPRQVDQIVHLSVLCRLDIPAGTELGITDSLETDNWQNFDSAEPQCGFQRRLKVSENLRSNRNATSHRCWLYRCFLPRRWDRLAIPLGTPSCHVGVHAQSSDKWSDAAAQRPRGWETAAT